MNDSKARPGQRRAAHVAELFVERAGRAQRLGRARVVAVSERKHAYDELDGGVLSRGSLVGGRLGPFHPLDAFEEQAANPPELPHPPRRARDTARLAVVEQPSERSTQVVVVEPHLANGLGLATVGVERAHPVGEVVGVAPAHVLEPRLCSEPLERELAKRLEHREARLGDRCVAADQALVKERGESLQEVRYVRDHALGRFEREPAPKDGKAFEQRLFALVQ
jgi:hypothetical protein